MSPANEKPLKSASLGLVLQQKVKEMGSNPRRLSAEIDYAYDHVRKVYNGSEFPGNTLLKKLCTYLKLDYEEMLSLVEADRAFDKGWLDLVLEEDPAVTDLKRFWPHLTTNDRAEILDLVKTKAARATSGKR